MVSFEVESLPDVSSVLGPPHRAAGLPYSGRRSMACVGATGELIELVEAG
jgi:hypothetical protein